MGQGGGTPAERRGVVHHSLFFLDSTGSALEQDGKDGKPGFKGMAFRRTGSLGGYVPGSTVQFLPGDVAANGACLKGSELGSGDSTFIRPEPEDGEEGPWESTSQMRPHPGV